MTNLGHVTTEYCFFQAAEPHFTVDKGIKLFQNFFSSGVKLHFLEIPFNLHSFNNNIHPQKAFAMPPSRSNISADSFDIKNKDIRSKKNVNQRIALSKAKREARFARKKEEVRNPELKRERLATNIPQTLETKRVYDERIWQPSDDLLRKPQDGDGDQSMGDNPEEQPEDTAQAEKQELLEKDNLAASEEFANLFPTTTSGLPPKILLTTTKDAKSYDTFHTLVSLFPNTTYIPRGKKFSVPEIASFAANREYTHVLLAVEDHKKVHGLTMITLPAGPTFHFSMSSWTNNFHQIEGKGKSTSHIPELILNNFATPLGKLTSGLFTSLYPALPDFKGRQVVTLHNQRDYIFFRRHRYVFRDTGEKHNGKIFQGKGDKTTGSERLGGVKAGEDLGVRVGLQELGPRFTLKLRRVERGVCEGIEWEWKGGSEKDRRKFQM